MDEHFRCVRPIDTYETRREPSAHWGMKMMAQADQYDEIRKHVEGRLKRRRDIAISVAVYVVTNIALWFFLSSELGVVGDARWGHRHHIPFG